MVIPSVGTVVLVSFPFSDLSRSNQPYTDPTAIEITNSDLASGSFRKDSYARPGKLFTANSVIMTKEIGELKPEKLEEIIRAIILLLEKSIV